MKKLVLLTLISLSSTITFAANKTDDKTNIFLQNCMHSGPGVSSMFQSCFNNNFYSISRIVPGFYRNCSNFGNQEVDYIFTSCVNDNFRDIERKLGNRVWMQHCTNFDRKGLDYTFVSCVNNNFRSIEREIRMNR